MAKTTRAAGDLDEFGLIERFLAPLAGAGGLGLLDDAAVLPAPAGRDLVMTSDTMVAGVHFLEDEAPQAIAAKLLRVNLSDLAAMGAAPLGVLSSLILPRDVDDDALEALARGQAQACQEAGTSVVGGNLARGEALSITTTVIGDAPTPLRRDGARPGDAVVVAGPLGLAAAGLRALLTDRAGDPVFEPALAAWRRPRARLDDGRRLARLATAAIDVSDGLALDLTRMADASGCKVVLSAEALVDARLPPIAAALGVDPLELAVSGGEDYALLATVPHDAELAGLARVGRCAAGEGVVLERASGEPTAVQPAGWDHFAPADDG